jgi:tetratricopeptide (TPR) repeat protein
MSDADLFISYRRKDAEQVLPLAAALRGRGLSVWLDQHAIGDFAPITDEIRHGLAQSRALLAWYSEDYPKSRPCQMELTAALLAAQREGDPRRRILVINPEPTAEHIEPVELRDAQYTAAPLNAAACASLAQRIAAHVAALPGPLGAILPVVPPGQYGLTLTGSNRFVGRLPDLWRIHSALHASENAIISGTTASGLAIVSGFGGVGKSLLAEEYALRFGAAYPGGIFWLRAYGNDTVHCPDSAAPEAGRLAQILAVAVDFDIETRGLDPSQVEARLRTKLSHNSQPFLWIVDDLASGLDANTVRAWFAPSPFGKTLVTTRSREYAEIGRRTALPLEVLTPQEALDLLCSRRTPVEPIEQAAAQDICQDLGYHALAVDVTAAALAAQTGLVSFAEFRANLSNPNEDELELAAELGGVLPSGHEKSVAATIHRSVRNLAEEGHDFLRLAALLAVAPIPPWLVVATFHEVDQTGEPHAKRRASRGQDEVQQASLAEAGQGGARLVHALVSRTIRFRDKKPERREALRAAVVAALTKVLSEVFISNPGPALALEVQHARALLGLGRGELRDLHTATLAAGVAWHDHQRGLYVVARPLQERVLEVLRQVLGEEHPDTLTSMHNLAMMLLAQGDLAGARRLHEHVLDARRRVLSENHPHRLASMHNLAQTLGAQGDLAGAHSLQERVLEAQRAGLGEDHPATLSAMHNLAVTLQAQGDLAGARSLHERVVEAQRAGLGEDHPDTLTTIKNLAGTLWEQGDLAGARRMQERALDGQRRVLGEDHPDTLTTINNLALTLQAQGDLAGARNLHEHVLETQRGALGDYHPDTLTSMDNLALTLQAQRDLAGARRLHERVLEGRRQILGDYHPATLTTTNNLAMTLLAQGDLAAARGLQERALQDLRRVLGEDHPTTLSSMNNLALTQQAQGDLVAARCLQERVLEVTRRVLGEDHPHTLTSMHNLAETLRAPNDPARARRLHERALEDRRRLLGEDHPDTLTSMHNLALTLQAQADLAGARSLQEGLLEILRRTLGEEHPSTLTSMHNLALTLQAQGDPAGARSLQEGLLEILRRTLGEEHPSTLTSMHNLALMLQAQGDLVGACGLHKRALDALHSVLGKQRDRTSHDNNGIKPR